MPQPEFGPPEPHKLGQFDPAALPKSEQSISNEGLVLEPGVAVLDQAPTEAEREVARALIMRLRHDTESTPEEIEAFIEGVRFRHWRQQQAEDN